MNNKLFLPGLFCLLSFGVCNYTLCQAQSNPCLQGYSGAQDPRDPNAICIPEAGRIYGLPAPEGKSIFALGDINKDGIDDWAVQTSRRYPIYPNEIKDVRIFLGKSGVLPTVADAQILRPGDTASLTTLVGWGDFDADDRIDIACRIEMIGDTSYGNPPIGSGHYDISRLVVFWGQDSGRYSLQDTTQIQCQEQAWLGIGGESRVDIDSDGVDDLCVKSSSGFSQGSVHAMAHFHIYRGQAGQRWGRGGVKRTADWTWWNVPGGNLSTLDHDRDGHPDLVFTDNISLPATVAILYGSPNDMPDTSSVQTVTFPSRSQYETLLLDVTGDGLPELLALWVGGSRIYIYAGLKGQRLKQQYGTGNDPPQPDSLKWWGKPWAQLFMPLAINSNWTNSIELYNFGDINLDGINDIGTDNDPYLTIYTAGKCMDSLIDGLIDIRGAAGGGGGVALFTNVMGTHQPMFALRGGSTVIFYRPTTDIPGTCWGPERRMPHLTSPVPREPDPSPGLRLDLTQKR